MPTQLEDLPNELFHEIFIYFDIPNLFKTFWTLNRRINYLLRTIKKTYFILDKSNTLLIEIFSKQIDRLKLDTSELIDLRQFNNIHTLELRRINNHQLEEMHSNQLLNLVKLIISTRHHISLPLSLIEEIFTNQFPHLRHIDVNRLDYIEISNESSSCLLEHVHISTKNIIVIQKILILCPNLKYFHVEFFGEDQNLIESNLNHMLLKTFLLEDPYHKLSHGTINEIFNCIPNVTYLYLQILCRIPFQDLIETISHRFEQLEEFYCEIVETSNNQSVDIEYIQQMNTCFQSIQCYEKSNNDRLYITA